MAVGIARLLRPTANDLRKSCRFLGSGTSYIEPAGTPWQNPWVESYGSRIRDELLTMCGALFVIDRYWPTTTR